MPQHRVPRRGWRAQSSGKTGGESWIARCSCRSASILVFGSFSSVVREPQSRALRRLDDRFVHELAAVIDEMDGAGIVSPQAIAAALNERGILTVRGRSWTAAAVRKLRLRASE